MNLKNRGFDKDLTIQSALLALSMSFQVILTVYTISKDGNLLFSITLFSVFMCVFVTHFKDKNYLLEINNTFPINRIHYLDMLRKRNLRKYLVSLLIALPLVLVVSMVYQFEILLSASIFIVISAAIYSINQAYVTIKFCNAKFAWFDMLFIYSFLISVGGIMLVEYLYDLSDLKIELLLYLVFYIVSLAYFGHNTKRKYYSQIEDKEVKYVPTY